MNDSEQFDSSSGFVSSNNSGAELDQLRKLMLIALVAMLIIAGSLNIFLIRQVIFVRKDLEGVRPQLNQLLANYQKVEDPQIKSFVNAMVNYGRTHPDFTPILAKYKLAAQPQAPATPTTPTGVPTVPQKKK